MTGSNLNVGSVPVSLCIHVDESYIAVPRRPFYQMGRLISVINVPSKAFNPRFIDEREGLTMRE